MQTEYFEVHINSALTGRLLSSLVSLRVGGSE